MFTLNRIRSFLLIVLSDKIDSNNKRYQPVVSLKVQFGYVKLDKVLYLFIRFRAIFGFKQLPEPPSQVRDVLIDLEYKCKDVSLEQLEVQILPQFQGTCRRTANEIDEDVSILVLKKVKNVRISKEAVKEFLVVSNYIVVQLLVFPFLDAFLVYIEDCYSSTIGYKIRKSTTLAVRIFVVTLVVTRQCPSSDVQQFRNEIDFLVVREAFQYLERNVFEYIIYLLVSALSRERMLRLEILSYVLTVNVYIVVLSTLKVVKGNGQTREIVSIVADGKFLDGVKMQTTNFFLNRY